jgi:hypothetical protein
VADSDEATSFFRVPISGRQIGLVGKVNQGDPAPVNFAEEIPGVHFFEKFIGMLDESLSDVRVSSLFRQPYK